MLLLVNATVTVYEKLHCHCCGVSVCHCMWTLLLYIVCCVLLHILVHCCMLCYGLYLVCCLLPAYFCCGYCCFILYVMHILYNGHHHFIGVLLHVIYPVCCPDIFYLRHCCFTLYAAYCIRLYICSMMPHGFCQWAPLPYMG